MNQQTVGRNLFIFLMALVIFGMFQSAGYVNLIDIARDGVSLVQELAALIPTP